MKFNCISCGTIIEAYKGNHKYCAVCRGEIELETDRTKSFKEAARIVCGRHKQGRENAEYLRMLNSRRKSIGDVVRMTTVTGLSYGHQVAKLEGREH